MASDGERERSASRSLSRSGRSSVDSETTRSTHSHDERRHNRALDRKLDKLLDGFSDFRRDIKAKFTGVHRDIQDIQQAHLSFEGALSRLSTRLEVIERASVNADDDDLCAKRRRQQRAGGNESSQASAAVAAPAVAAPRAPSREPLRPRVTLSGFADRHSVEEYGDIITELFGELEDIKISCKMLFHNSVQIEFATLAKAKTFREKIIREKPSFEGKALFCNFVLPWKESRMGFLAREAKRQLGRQMADLPDGSIRLCARSNTIFFRHAVAAYVDEKSMALVAGPAWPREVD